MHVEIASAIARLNAALDRPPYPVQPSAGTVYTVGHLCSMRPPDSDLYYLAERVSHTGAIRPVGDAPPEEAGAFLTRLQGMLTGVEMATGREVTL